MGDRVRQRIKRDFFIPWAVIAIIGTIAYFAGAPLFLAAVIGFVGGSYVFARQEIEELTARVENLERETLNLGPMPDE